MEVTTILRNRNWSYANGPPPCNVVPCIRQTAKASILFASLRHSIYPAILALRGEFCSLRHRRSRSSDTFARWVGGWRYYTSQRICLLTRTHILRPQKFSWKHLKLLQPQMVIRPNSLKLPLVVITHSVGYEACENTNMYSGESGPLLFLEGAAKRPITGHYILQLKIRSCCN